MPNKKIIKINIGISPTGSRYFDINFNFNVDKVIINSLIKFKEV